MSEISKEEMLSRRVPEFKEYGRVFRLETDSSDLTEDNLQSARSLLIANFVRAQLDNPEWGLTDWSLHTAPVTPAYKSLPCPLCDTEIGNYDCRECDGEGYVTGDRIEGKWWHLLGWYAVVPSD